MHTVSIRESSNDLAVGKRRLHAFRRCFDVSDVTFVWTRLVFDKLVNKRIVFRSSSSDEEVVAESLISDGCSNNRSFRPTKTCRGERETHSTVWSIWMKCSSSEQHHWPVDQSVQGSLGSNPLTKPGVPRSFAPLIPRRKTCRSREFLNECSRFEVRRRGKSSVCSFHWTRSRVLSVTLDRAPPAPPTTEPRKPFVPVAIPSMNSIGPSIVPCREEETVRSRCLPEICSTDLRGFVEERLDTFDHTTKNNDVQLFEGLILVMFGNLLRSSEFSLNIGDQTLWGDPGARVPFTHFRMTSCTSITLTICRKKFTKGEFREQLLIGFGTVHGETDMDLVGRKTVHLSLRRGVENSLQWREMKMIEVDFRFRRSQLSVSPRTIVSNCCQIRTSIHRGCRRILNTSFRWHSSAKSKSSTFSALTKFMMAKITPWSTRAKNSWSNNLK